MERATLSQGAQEADERKAKGKSDGHLAPRSRAKLEVYTQAPTNEASAVYIYRPLKVLSTYRPTEPLESTNREDRQPKH